MSATPSDMGRPAPAAGAESARRAADAPRRPIRKRTNARSMYVPDRRSRRGASGVPAATTRSGMDFRATLCSAPKRPRPTEGSTVCTSSIRSTSPAEAAESGQIQTGLLAHLGDQRVAIRERVRAEFPRLDTALNGLASDPVQQGRLAGAARAVEKDPLGGDGAAGQSIQ